jgi:polyisoprenyl-phosphate glycosyltransferase
VTNASKPARVLSVEAEMTGVGIMSLTREGARISIVVPVFNEEGNLPELYRRIIIVMNRVRLPFELIFVDDGSIDRSLNIILEFTEKDKNVKAIQLSRNFGHQLAILAGIDYARGEAVIMMDGDLQHPPELIEKLIEKWQEGNEVVYTRRDQTQDASFFKNFTAWCFYMLANRLAEVNISAGTADFRLLDRSVVESLRTFEERSIFLRGVIYWMGYRQASISYRADTRYSGESKYSFLKMLRFAMDGITSFSSIPLYISALLGLVISLCSFLYAANVVYFRLFTDRVVEGWTSVMVVILFLGGIHLLTVGIQGIYLGQIYKEIKRRPRYLIRRIYGTDR